MISTVYLNGDFIPPEEAHISVLDRGFLFGDGAYEVIPVYSRYPFRFDEHLRRLQVTLDGIRLPNPLSREAWRQIIERLVAETPFEDQSVYIQITRGVGKTRDHAFPQGIAPTVLAMTMPLKSPPPELREHGATAITTDDIRWLRCDLKALTLLANVLLRQKAVDAGCTEAILLRDGFLTEGTTTNIFIVNNGCLLTPPNDHLVLAGVTHDLVLELAQAHSLPVEIRPISETELRRADEVWMTSSTREILPITMIDHHPVADGVPGHYAKEMYGWYSSFKNNIMRCHSS